MISLQLGQVPLCNFHCRSVGSSEIYCYLSPKTFPPPPPHCLKHLRLYWLIKLLTCQYNTTQGEEAGENPTVIGLSVLTDLKCKSKTFPPHTINSNASLFLHMVTNEMTAMTNKPPTHNLSLTHQEALSQLKALKDIVIKEADKCGCVVVLDLDFYKQLCFDIINNTSWYRPTDFTQVDRHMVDFYTLVDKAYDDNLISKTIWEFIRTPAPRTPTFYCLPKIHKEGYLRGRPIISGSGSLTEGASRYIDCILRPHVEALFSYTKNNLSLLKFLEDPTVPPGSILASIDVECLYNSTPHQLGVQIVGTFLDQTSPDCADFNPLC